MATTLDRVFLRPMTAEFARVFSLRTTDTSPELNGLYRCQSAPSSIKITVNGSTYLASFADGSWTLPAGTIAPALAAGTYDVGVEVVCPNGSIFDRTVDELTIDGSAEAIAMDDDTAGAFIWDDDSAAIIWDA